jgi:hypothetical protein
MSEKRVLRRIFGPMRDEATRESRKLHNEELNDLYCSPNIMRVIKSREKRWSTYGGEMRAWGLVGIVEGKKPLERPRHRWEDNIKVNIQGNVGGAWTGSVWLRIGAGGVFLWILY